MKTSIIAALAAASMLKMVTAHTTVHSILVNDVDQGIGNQKDQSGYIRTPPSNSPITDVTSPDMKCNVGGTGPAKQFIEVAGGDKVTFQWFHDNPTPADDIIADSHRGPVLTYIAPAESNGEGDVWLKLAEEGFSNGKFGVDNLIANRGKHSVTLPDLAAGDYILRPEIIALHEGNRANGAQFYMECVQITVTSSGSVTLPAGVSIPGAYSPTDPGVLFDLYNGFTEYPIPGPPVFEGAVGGSPAPGPAPGPGASPSPNPGAPAPNPGPGPAPGPTTTGASAPTTLVTSVKPTSTGPAPAPVPGENDEDTCDEDGTENGDSTVQVQKYQQCGGKEYSGPTTCATGSTCKELNPYYSQCL